MMRAIANSMSQRASIAANSTASVKLGIVTSYDPANYSAKVQLQPEGTETGWLPISTPFVGSGWGMFCPPSIGDMVEVQFQEGGIEAGFICGRMFNDDDRPVSCPIGEFYLIHKTGSYVKLFNDGRIKFNSTVEIDAGNMASALHTLVHDAFMSLYNGHTHTSATSGSPTSSPLQQMNASHLTTILKGN